MKKIIFLTAAVLTAVFVCSAGTAKGIVKATDLKVEMQSDPVGVASESPRLSWILDSSSQVRDVRQRSYHILVASTKAILDKNQGDLWNSGVIDSGQSLYVRYEGKPLKSGQKAYWKVKVVTTKGETGWSDEGRSVEPAMWQMSMSPDETWTAEWIGGNFPDDHLQIHSRVNARYLRKDFPIDKKVESAVMYISGLGLCNAYVNGIRLGDDVRPDGTGEQMLTPTLSDYDKTVYFETYDVTRFLKRGANAIGIILGNGRYMSTRYNPGKKSGTTSVRHFDLPKLLLQMDVTYADGTVARVVSDGSWMITDGGPIRSNNEYDGEEYDARKAMEGWNAAGFAYGPIWKPVEKVSAPAGSLKAQPNPNIRVMDLVRPVKITEIASGKASGKTYILDMGQNMVGVLALKNISGQQPGDSIKMHFAELLKDDGTAYYDNLRTAECTDTYVCADGKIIRDWQPSFVYHGFRFVEIKGLRNKPELCNFIGKVCYDDMKTTASLETSNNVINQVFRNAYWGVRGNYRGMPTDCPQRDERMGWTGDRVTGCYGEAYLLDNHLLYSKWLSDIEDAQKSTGSIPDVAPAYWNNYSNNLTWPAVFLTGPDMIFRHYGDPQPIIDHYDAMKKWLSFMKGKYGKDGIITKDTYGDWCMPPESPKLIHSKDPDRITKGALLSTAFYYYLCGLMSDFAPIAGHPEDSGFFKDEQAATKDAFNATYFNSSTGSYDNNTVTANILPLRFGMVPEGYEEKVFANIKAKTEGDFKGHVSTGVVGIQQLMRGLTEYGAPELALKIASNDTYPSWGYMASHGATTIWELWNGDTANPSMNSANHVMLLGDLIIWDMEYLSGISAAEPGFKTVRLKPNPIKGLSYAKASYDSVYGRITSDWKKEGNEFIWNFAIPCNTAANVFIPVKGGISEQDRRSVEAAGGKFVSDGGSFALFTFPSGSYSIKTSYEE